MTTLALTADARSRPMPFGMAVFFNTAIYLVFAGAAGYAGLSDTGAPLSPETSTTSAFELFWHNVGVLIWLATGLCSAGLMTGAVMAINGIILGWVVGKQLASGDIHSLFTGMLPHFPLEIAAYVISAAASMRLGAEIFSWLRHRRGSAATWGWQAWGKAQGVAVGLLLIAAIVEANVSHV